MKQWISYIIYLLAASLMIWGAEEMFNEQLDFFGVVACMALFVALGKENAR